MNARRWTLFYGVAIITHAGVLLGSAEAVVPEGHFTGQLGPLTIVLHLEKSSEGHLAGTLDSPNQGASGLLCSDLHIEGQAFSFRVPVVNGRWEGVIEDDGNTLAGTWSQGASLSLVFRRGLPEPLPGVSVDPAIAPIDAAQLEQVLRKDLQHALESGVLARGKPIAVGIGVITPGKRSVFMLGNAPQDALFEIGSITKTFTGLALAQLIEQGKVRTETPVRELLPPRLVKKPLGSEITLLDLVTQHSGLPRLPDNFQPEHPDNPYVDYDTARLYAFMGRHGVAKPEDTGFLYSNLGFGLLGRALCNFMGKTYPELVRELVLHPLGLNDTTVTLSFSQQARFVQGYSVDMKPIHSWELDALAGAGALRSTAGDMLGYLEAYLDPDRLKGGTGSGRTLAAALRRAQRLEADVGANARIAFAWLYESTSNTYWHNGATGGFTSFAFFSPVRGQAAVVLVNMAADRRGSFADVLGQHIGQRLTGQPATSLSQW